MEPSFRIRIEFKNPGHLPPRPAGAAGYGSAPLATGLAVNWSRRDGSTFRNMKGLDRRTANDVPGVRVDHHPGHAMLYIPRGRQRCGLEQVPAWCVARWAGIWLRWRCCG